MYFSAIVIIYNNFTIESISVTKIAARIFKGNFTLPFVRVVICQDTLLVFSLVKRNGMFFLESRFFYFMFSCFAPCDLYMPYVFIM